MRWYDDFSIVLGLGEWLIDNDILTTPQGVQRYYEKPWKYELEYRMYVRWLNSPDEQEREMIVELTQNEEYEEADD